MFRTTMLAALLALAAPTAQAQEKLTLILDWFVNPDHGPLYVAQEAGYFAEEGLEVEMTEPGDPNDPPKLVAAGRYDLAISYQPQLHMQAAEGLPVVRIGTLVDQPLNSLVVLEHGPIKEIADLEGRKIGFSVGGFEEALLTAMLGEAGLTMDDVRLVNVNFALSPALMSGQVAAVIGAYRNFELNQLEIEGRKGRAFLPEEHGVPAYDELVFIARKGMEGDDRFAAFLRAVTRGVEHLKRDPEGAWALFVEGREDKLDDELNRKAWEDTVPLFADEPAKLDREKYQAFADFLRKHEVIGELPPVEEYAVELEAAR